MAIIDSYEIPSLKDTIITLQESGETFIGYNVGEVICGVIGIKSGAEEIDIHRLIVHPDYLKEELLRNF